MVIKEPSNKIIILIKWPGNADESRKVLKMTKTEEEKNCD